MSVSIEIAGEAAHVRIVVVGYERLDGGNASDANWLTARIEARIRDFEGRVDAALTTHDFVRFGHALQCAFDTLRGEACFETTEGALRLVVTLRPTGTATIKGHVRDSLQADIELSFSFESDQTYIRRALSGLADVRSTFPVRP